MNTSSYSTPPILIATRATTASGCCPVQRFGAEAPRYAGLDLPASALLDTLLLPFAIAAELGVGLGVSGGI